MSTAKTLTNLQEATAAYDAAVKAHRAAKESRARFGEFLRTARTDLETADRRLAFWTAQREERRARVELVTEREAAAVEAVTRTGGELQEAEANLAKARTAARSGVEERARAREIDSLMGATA